MAERVQSYKKHARIVPPFHYFVLPVLALNVVNQGRHLWQAPSLGAAWAVVMALALVTLALYARVMALTVQDRVIRLEMRLRLQELLPADLKTRIHELTPRQLVALRFACDAELPGLVREVLNGQLKSSKEIKMRVKEWQGDWLRA